MINRQGNHRTEGTGIMDTRTIATALNTEPKILRRFLRDPRSTFSAVGSGARYVFTDADLPELARRFEDWSGTKLAQRPTVVRTVPVVSQEEMDAEVWAKEEEEHGPVVMADLRDPRIRARVQRVAADQIRRLDEMLMAAGLHLSQQNMRDRVAA
jgi:hypothetical protein